MSNTTTYNKATITNPPLPPNTNPNYIDVICTSFQTQLDIVPYPAYPNVVIDIYKEMCNVNTNRPVIICLHGGGGTRKNPSIIEYAQDFASRGYLAVCADYGSTNIDTMANVCAINRYFRANAVAYGINTSNIIDMGVSLGGITAWQVNIGAKDLDSGTPFFSKPINSENSSYSSVPLCTMSQSGAPTAGVLAYLTNQSHAHFDYHGTVDCTVSYSSAQCGVSGALQGYNAMQALGIASTFTPYLGAAHILQPYHSQILLGGGTQVVGQAQNAYASNTFTTDIGIIRKIAALLVP